MKSKRKKEKNKFREKQVQNFVIELRSTMKKDCKEFKYYKTTLEQKSTPLRDAKNAKQKVKSKILIQISRTSIFDLIK